MLIPFISAATKVPMIIKAPRMRTTILPLESEDLIHLLHLNALDLDRSAIDGEPIHHHIFDLLFLISLLQEVQTSLPQAEHSVIKSVYFSLRHSLQEVCSYSVSSAITLGGSESNIMFFQKTTLVINI